MLGITANAQAKSTEKISSGFKINRAVDDAAGTKTGANGGMTLQIGANEGQTMNFAIGNMSAEAFGVAGNKVNIASREAVEKATTVIYEAIKKVSAQRSTLGAVQNRLEHTIANLDTAAENTQNAESRIRDTDMASERVKFSNNNILAQAGQAMLAFSLFGCCLLADSLCKLSNIKPFELIFSVQLSFSPTDCDLRCSVVGCFYKETMFV